MTEWKVVPVEPTDEQIDAALEYDIFDQVRGAGRIVALHLYQDLIAAAPRPPVVLPPLPEAAHGYYSVPMYSADQMHAYALAAIAQYGIVDRQEDAA